MNMGLSNAEGRVLHGLLEDVSGDVVIRLDASGFIVFASESISAIGQDLSSLLLMPHIADLAQPDYRPLLEDHARQVLAGEAACGGFEFPVIEPGATGECDTNWTNRWFALSLRRIETKAGSAEGAIGLLRSIEEKRSLEGELHNRAVTDPLTGLPNRQALCSQLHHCLAEGGGDMLAVFAVDTMRAMLIQYGQRTADEIMWGFARFLEGMALPGQQMGQIDTERLAVVLSGYTPHHARQWAGDVIETFCSLALPSSSRSPSLSASAGLARVEHTVDWTLRQAEIGLVMARAGGGKQVGECEVRKS